MEDATFSPTRSKSTWKPCVMDNPLPFLRCSECGSILTGIDGDCTPTTTGANRMMTFNHPYGLVDFTPTCCGKPMEKVEFAAPLDVADKILLDYQICGSYDNNCLKVMWNVMEEGYEPRWFALKTFTGMQTKYLTEGKRSPLTFAFADEDAFAYCDEDPCVECTFRCKRGFEFYAYVEKIGIIRVPLDRMIATGSANFDALELPSDRMKRLAKEAAEKADAE